MEKQASLFLSVIQKSTVLFQVKDNKKIKENRIRDIS